MVLYGVSSTGDAYDGPMLGLLWNATDDSGHGGDGDSEPVTVRGQAGVAAPITVFQQVILPELGTVIAWSEGGRALGLYGRLWPLERRDELVAIANKIEAVDSGFLIPDGVLPNGYAEVFSGDPSVTSIVLAPSPLYSLRYEADDGLLDINGLQMSEAEFEAFRFFTMSVDQDEVAGRPALAGNAWNKEGPSVVTWRESDGLVVRIVGLGVPLETAREVAARSRELLRRSGGPCPGKPRRMQERLIEPASRASGRRRSECPRWALSATRQGRDIMPPPWVPGRPHVLRQRLRRDHD